MNNLEVIAESLVLGHLWNMELDFSRIIKYELSLLLQLCYNLSAACLTVSLIGAKPVDRQPACKNLRLHLQPGITTVTCLCCRWGMKCLKIYTDPLALNISSRLLWLGMVKRLGQRPEELYIKSTSCTDKHFKINEEIGLLGCAKCQGPDWQWKTEAFTLLYLTFCKLPRHQPILRLTLADTCVLQERRAFA